ncbi:MAG: magnesium chelatase subunit H [Methanothrix sp.]
MKIIFVSPVLVPSLVKAAQNLRDEFNLVIDLEIYHPGQIDNDEIDAHAFSDSLKSADAVLIDLMGAGSGVIDLLSRQLMDENNIVISLVIPMGRAFKEMMSLTRMGSFRGKRIAEMIGSLSRSFPDQMINKDPEGLRNRMLKAKTMMDAALNVTQAGGNMRPVGPMKDASNYVKFTKYWKFGGKENYRNLLVLLLHDYLGCSSSLPKAGDPVEMQEYGIYHPDYGHFSELEDFLQKTGFDEDLPTVGVLLYGGRYFDQGLVTLKALACGLGQANLIPVYSDGINNLQAMRRFFFRDNKPIIDALVNLTMFRINGGPLGGDHRLTRDLFRELNVPVFTPASMHRRRIAEWIGSPTGLSPMETIMSVIWPELDGSIEPIPCCGVDEVQDGGITTQEVVSIPDRMKRITSRIKNRIKLCSLPNAEKRVALIIYSYPPGDGNLGGASFLDVFKSLVVLLKRLEIEGYQTIDPKEKLHQIFEQLSLANSGIWLSPQKAAKNCFRLGAKQYHDYFASLPQELQQDVTASWGEPPGKVMVQESDILIPGIVLGNVFIGIQPCRPPLKDQDLAAASHDKTAAPHHQYIAFYLWLKMIWKADAVVHVGTHGLAEFTKGKEVGMSKRCFPDLLIGDMPHLYFYHITNTSEAVVAKRRFYATIIGHNNPPYTFSDLYEDYVELQKLIDEFAEARIQDPQRAPRIREQILSLAETLNFQELDVEKIHDELYRMRRSIIPKGLHTLGESYSHENLAVFLASILRYDRSGIKSLNRIFAECEGIDYDLALKDRAAFLPRLEKIDEQCVRLVVDCLQRSVDEAARDVAKKCDFSLHQKEELSQSLNYGLKLMHSYADNSLEIENLIRGLRGEFIEQGEGGDVIRSPEVLPSGRNLIQFDPTRVPTPAACERGEEIACNTLAAYRKKNGDWPESTGVVLWGFETTKTGGETIGQILCYLGLRVNRSKATWALQLEPISLEELGRPRIDCLVNICGFFRDMFPNIMEFLDQAFDLAANLDEPLHMNYVRKHSLENRSHLAQAGLDEKTAGRIANGRVFGPRAGEYGTRLLPLVEDSIWKTEDELAEIFIQSVSHIYAKDLHAFKAESVYRENLARVKLVSQVRDTHDHEIIDLDHYFEYFGGLSNAIKSAGGDLPQMLITDTTGEAICTEDLQDSVNRGIRTRLLNPKWIDAMLEHDYHGGQQIAKRVENALGLAATTHSIADWVWSAIAERYIFDEPVRERLEKNNKFACGQVMERLLEAERRGYWNATGDELERLKEAYLDLEGEIEEAAK